MAELYILVITAVLSLVACGASPEPIQDFRTHSNGVAEKNDVS